MVTLSRSDKQGLYYKIYFGAPQFHPALMKCGTSNAVL